MKAGMSFQTQYTFELELGQEQVESALAPPSWCGDEAVRPSGSPSRCCEPAAVEIYSLQRPAERCAR